MALVVGQIGSGGVHVAAVAGELLGGHGQQLLRGTILGVAGAAEGVHIDHGPALQAAAEILPLADEIAELTGDEARLEHGVQTHAHLFHPRPGGTVEVRLVAEDHDGVLGDEVHGGGEFGVDQAHIAVRGRVTHAVFVLFQVRLQGLQELFVDIFPPLLAGDQLFDVGAEAAQTLGVEPGLGLAHGQDHDGIGVLGAPLGVRVEVAHGVQLVTEELGTDGPVGGGGVDVHDAAPDGELAGALHHAAAGVACVAEPVDQLLQGVLPAHLQSEGGPAQDGRGDGPLGEGFPGEDLQFCLARCQRKELVQPLLLPGPGHHGGVVQRQLPAGQHRGGFAQEGGQLLADALGGHVILTDDYHRPVKFPAEPGDQMAAVDLTQTRDGGGLISPDGLQKKLIFGDVFQKREKFFHEITSMKKKTVGNAVLGVPSAEGGSSVRFAGTVLAHRTRRNAGDGVPYGKAGQCGNAERGNFPLSVIMTIFGYALPL